MATATKNGQRKKADNSESRKKGGMVSDRKIVDGTRGAKATQTDSHSPRKAYGRMATRS